MNEHTKILVDEILAPLAKDNKVSFCLKNHKNCHYNDYLYNFLKYHF